MSSPLYTTVILRLAMLAAGYPRLPNCSVSGEARTQVCGSHITVDLLVHGDMRVRDVGMEVHACAMGQASAGLFADSVKFRNAADIALARDALAAWLSGTSEIPPKWRGITALAPARDYPARHAAILLPYDAALAALLPWSTTE